MNTQTSITQSSITLETDDLRIDGIKEVCSPDKLKAEVPITAAAAQTVFAARTEMQSILHDKDDRLLVVVGPCSVHDTEAALEYAGKLAVLKEELKDDLLIVMRVYFEKPRTTVGWKGLINDPDLDGSFHINKGLRIARGLLQDLAEQGMPAAVEYLDLISPQYIADLVSWGAIGARTTESQGHRELSSGLSCPVGFKNGTDGSIQIAIDAIGAASHPHNFMSVTKRGHSAIFSTVGNNDCHIILRGGKGVTNYDAASVQGAAEGLEKAGLNSSIMIDFSHANSEKQHERQIAVGQDVGSQISNGEMRIKGVMIESNLVEGRQGVVDGKAKVYGQSITDACINWEDTTPLLRSLAEAARTRRETRKS